MSDFITYMYLCTFMLRKEKGRRKKKTGIRKKKTERMKDKENTT